MALMNIWGALFGVHLVASFLALAHQADGQLLTVIKTPIIDHGS